jgi:type I restriction enzyme S subunit
LGLSFEWNKVTIGEVVESVIDNRGKTPPLTESGYELIEINAIVGKNRYPNYEKVSKFVSEDTYRTWFRKGHPQKDDLLISTVGSIGEVCLMERDRGCIAQNVIALRFHKKIANSMFFYYFFSWEETKTRLKTLDIGSVQPSLKVPHLLSTNLLMPPIEEQANIAAILSSLDDKLELNNAINKNLEEMAQALFKRWFVDFEFPNENGEPYKSNGGEFEESELGLIPKGWTVGVFENISSCYDSKRVPLSKKERESRAKIYPYYGAASLMDYVDDYLFEGVYVLMGEDGTVVDEEGFPVLQYVWGKFWVNNHAHVLKGNSAFSEEYIYLLLKRTNVKHIVTGAVQPKINQKNMNSIKVVIPPKDILYKFNKTISGLFGLIRENTDQNRILINIRDTLLPKLMSGEIRVPVEQQ